MPAETGPHSYGYVDPALGIDAFKDAAAIRCCAAGDAEGVHAILAGTDAPRHVAWALTVIAALICAESGLDADAVADLVTGIASHASDAFLDQKRPDTAVGEVM
ncbi:hypothetical protein K7472_09930 [Streptomyces sp. PTM05]|uniref:Uncharacterized protein n=1 Tax=Streptantibioticus parmotrematis TaxID=2873249 RepID=A0ABS7QPN8_9ACTN|nr:hypothetical protein [Streptantibioticus parmotrematis]MBY8885161.1 hypothetical protein [Streptantibioticus parmotrematis]